MIDGVKIRCIGTAPEKWECNPLLKFGSKVDTATGEILKGSKVAFYRGLSFHIIPSTIAESSHLLIRGSLATYYNNGLNNAFDFNIGMLKEVLAELQNTFSINLNTAVLLSLEYGANINPSKPTKSILQGLRAYKGNEYALLKVDGSNNGKQLKRTETITKIYDKSKQIGNPTGNLLRIEYVLKYSRQMKAYGINTLIDLLNIEVLERLKTALLSVWDESIFYDSGMNWRNMANKEREKMLFYLDATNWAKFTPMQRLRAKQKFNELKALFCSSTTQADISQLLAQKLDTLTAGKCYVFQSFLGTNRSRNQDPKMLRFPSLDKGRIGNQNDNKNTNKNGLMKTTKYSIKNGKKADGKNCIVCGSDISHKNKSSLYCSKRCNNSKQAQARKKKRHTTKLIETAYLDKLITVLDKSNLHLLTTYWDAGQSYTDALTQKEIATTYYWIRKVRTVQVKQRGKPITLTSYRAKKLIHIINKQNLSE